MGGSLGLARVGEQTGRRGGMDRPGSEPLRERRWDRYLEYLIFRLAKPLLRL